MLFYFLYHLLFADQSNSFIGSESNSIVEIAFVKNETYGDLPTTHDSFLDALSVKHRLFLNLSLCLRSKYLIQLNIQLILALV
jgi:hypothetical protein